MNAEQMWKLFCRSAMIDETTHYESWAFGGLPDELAELVKSGVKTATASGYDLYFLPDEAEPLPKVGDYSVILNSADEAVCVIQTTGIRICPFDAVSAEHAFREGEGDRSLTYWRMVHESFFLQDFSAAGLVFNHSSRILCEEFALCFTVGNNESSVDRSL